MYGLVTGVLFAASFSVPAQEPAQDEGQATQPMTLDRTLATLHGVVRNAASGEGLPRALVRIEGDADAGTLTDGDGRFELRNIPVGPQSVTVQKPGFLDRGLSPSASQTAIVAQDYGNHNVMVAADMPDVVFTLEPTGAIRGQVELSTGDAAEGMTVALVRRTIDNGRAVLQMTSSTKTRSDGTYRFGALAEGEYEIFSEPTMDSDLDQMFGGAGPHWGYPSVYYPDARDPSGAAKIHVAAGQETQANLTLTLENFQPVTATIVSGPAGSADHAIVNLSGSVLDNGGHQLQYQSRMDPKSHSFEAELPDGSYSLLLSSTASMGRPAMIGSSNEGLAAGSVDVTVAGRPVPNLRVALSAIRTNPIQVILERNAASPVPAGPIDVMVSQAGGWIDDSMISSFANGALPGPLETAYTRPGSYWVHTRNQRGLCVESFTAGGVNLAREPLVIGLSGSTAPMDLTLRDDCASLELSLPDNLASITAGEEPFFTVFVVPDFDSTVDVEHRVFRASTGGSFTWDNLTPGSYHVYMLPGAVELEYRNRAALASLPIRGHAVTLSPGATSTLVVEAPGQ